MVLMVGTFSQPGISKQQAEELKKEIAELKELVNSKHIRTEALLSLALEKESITQDKFDELMNMLREFGRQKGFKVK